MSEVPLGHRGFFFYRGSARGDKAVGADFPPLAYCHSSRPAAAGDLAADEDSYARGI